MNTLLSFLLGSAAVALGTTSTGRSIAKKAESYVERILEAKLREYEEKPKKESNNAPSA
jgi:hypothetical protein